MIYAIIFHLTNCSNDFEGENVSVNRKLMGATNPKDAEENT